MASVHRSRREPPPSVEFVDVPFEITAYSYLPCNFQFRNNAKPTSRDCICLQEEKKFYSNSSIVLAMETIEDTISLCQAKSIYVGDLRAEPDKKYVLFYGTDNGKIIGYSSAFFLKISQKSPEREVICDKARNDDDEESFVLISGPASIGKFADQADAENKNVHEQLDDLQEINYSKQTKDQNLQVYRDRIAELEKQLKESTENHEANMRENKDKIASLKEKLEDSKRWNGVLQAREDENVHLKRKLEEAEKNCATVLQVQKDENVHLKTKLEDAEKNLATSKKQQEFYADKFKRTTEELEASRDSISQMLDMCKYCRKHWKSLDEKTNNEEKGKSFWQKFGLGGGNNDPKDNAKPEGSQSFPTHHNEKAKTTHATVQNEPYSDSTCNGTVGIFKGHGTFAMKGANVNGSKKFDGSTRSSENQKNYEEAKNTGNKNGKKTPEDFPKADANRYEDYNQKKADEDENDKVSYEFTIEEAKIALKNKECDICGTVFTDEQDLDFVFQHCKEHFEN